MKKLKLNVNELQVLTANQLKNIQGGYDNYGLCPRCCHSYTSCTCHTDEAVQALDSNPYA